MHGFGDRVLKQRRRSKQILRSAGRLRRALPKPANAAAAAGTEAPNVFGDLSSVNVAG